MAKHLAQLRNKSIGSWFAKLRDHPDSYWVWLGDHEKYKAITAAAKFYPPNSNPEDVELRSMSYRIPTYMESMLESTPNYDPKMVDMVFAVALLKVDIIDLGKGKYPKVRPYIVRLSADAIRILEKRCWEMTGEMTLDGKVWKFNQQSHNAWGCTGRLKSHVKYPIRDGLTYVEHFDAFEKDNFDFEGRKQVSLHEGLRYVITESYFNDTKLEWWQYNRAMFLKELKKRFMADE